MPRSKVFAATKFTASLILTIILATVATAADNDVAASDKKFIKEAAAGGMLEVKLGELASKNGADQSVKDLGQMMVTDHTKANEQLMTLAQTKGVDVPKELDAKGQKQVDKLSKLSGEEFDKAYVKEMIKDHEKDIKEFKKQAKDGKDADLKKFAEDTVPTLEHHLEATNAAADKVGVKKGADHGKAGDHADHEKKDK